MRAGVSWGFSPCRLGLAPRGASLREREAWWSVPAGSTRRGNGSAVILALTLFMPLMEVIPTSGSLASAVIAVFVAGLLVRDGGLVLASLVLLLAVPVAVWHFGFAG
ncbi:exopolysaccharide biosynthesis protein [Salinarimonas ramus]|uniref:Uncharacterized protein n=1 Tax=Salinarimonas ramus TaxID=690164 RepID=A0A917V2H5_9HYPH|nr:exopolysaccharide biosynthesis protein [Salinarimonas ramus]GGK28316.1 hypothetical protein GCM10011322_13520 [Salinarimonas ramus]